MNIKYRYKMIFINIFICSISFIMFSCKKDGENSELEVAGGIEIDDSKYPGVVHIMSFSESDEAWGSCTGSIISSNAVLTATHCTHFSQYPSRVYIDKNRFVTTQKIVINSNYIDYKTFLEKFECNEENYKRWRENIKNDIAIWIFPDGTFKNYEGKLQISDIDFKELEQEDVLVRVVGWGCYTELKPALDKDDKEITATVNGKIYKKYQASCDSTREAVKRTGTNVIDVILEDHSYIELYSKKVDRINGQIQKGTGSHVQVTRGDSGGPLLIADQNIKILGVASYVEDYSWDKEYCDLVYKTQIQKYDCMGYSSGYTNPVSSYSMNVLVDAVDNHKAIIPGIQVGVRVIEYNGKVKILYKEEKTSFNENVEEYKVVNKFNNNRYNTVEALKQAWRGTDFYERSKASWVFE